jgi:hypothetical protein
MNSLDVFCCAVSEDKHYFIEPIAMSCGHHLCKLCIPSNSEIVCKICNKLNKINLKDMEVSVPCKAFLRLYLKDLVELSKQKFDESLNCLKSKILWGKKNIFSNLV